MNSGEEKWYTLQNKNSVYIGYFTAWVDDKMKFHFMKNLYKREHQLLFYQITIQNVNDR
jgi:murein L,D-transpeptidase YcbB/YkuD